MDMKRDVELLFEISTFRLVRRVWEQFLNPDAANNAEHSFRVTWIALTLAKLENIQDHEKVIKMALMHDIAESRACDVNYLSRQYVERNEKMAIEDMFNGTVHVEELLALFNEYEERETPESKIVKDADNLDVQLELVELEHKGYSIGKIKKELRANDVYSKLFTESAKKLWKEISDANPHDWHLNGRNRHVAGDWKKEEN